MHKYIHLLYSYSTLVYIVSSVYFMYVYIMYYAY